MPLLRRTEPLLGQLLRYAAAEQSAGDEATAFEWRLERVRGREFAWVMEGGLGALLFRATRGSPEIVPAAWRAPLLSADLTARVRYSQQVETAKEVIDCCAALGVPVTLLKGISTSEEFYPLPHVRSMVDVDVLVERAALGAIESALIERGYAVRESRQTIEGHHHGAPLLDPRREVWVELHHKLFPDYDELGRGRLFGLANIAKESVISSFHGRTVRRLGHELQLAYIASSWTRDISLSQIHPSFVHSLFDAMRLLVATRDMFDWSRLLALVDSPLAAQSLDVMLTYLRRRRMSAVPLAVVNSLARQRGALRPFERRAMHAILDRYLIGGRHWNLPMPAPFPGRYFSARRGAGPQGSAGGPIP